jgi:tripartite-type tricarboxylate transporter receptor subunit TctC
LTVLLDITLMLVQHDFAEGRTAPIAIRGRREGSVLRNFLCSVAGVLLGGMAAASAAADPVADFYTGKTITIIIPFEPGGGSAGYGKLAIDHMGRYIPGNPSFQAEYMPGGGGLRAANHAAQVSPKDGTVLLVPNDGIAVSQILNPDKVQYDAREFRWIGIMSQNWFVLGLRKDTGIASVDDLKAKEFFVGSSGVGSPTDLFPRLTNGLLGTKLNIVAGFQGGSTEQILAVEKGEMHGSTSTWRSWTRRKDLLDAGVVFPLVQYGNGRSPEIPDVPNIVDLLTDPTDQQVARFVTSPAGIGRGLTALPGTPEDRVAALREAFAKMLEDPAFIADAAAQNLPLDGSMTGEEAQKLVEDALNSPPEVVARAKAVTGAE